MYDNNYLAHQLHAASQGRGDALFAELVDGNTLSYAQLFTDAEKIANRLLEFGLSPGDRVAVQVSKSIEAIELYLATILAGGVFLPLNTAYTEAELSYFIGDAEPAVVVCDPESYDSLQALCANAGVKQLLTLSADGRGSLLHKLPGSIDGFESVARDENDLAAILYTSGTTGRSKGAMLSHANLLSNALTLKDYWHFNRDDILIHALPIFHTHGLFVAINTTLCAGSSLIFMPSFDAEKVIEYMQRATVLMGVPTFYVRLLASQNLSSEATENMRLFISGSAPMLTETHKSWEAATGHVILERYGMTETNMNTSNPYNDKRKPGTVGFPLPQVEVKICDPNTGKELTQGEVGSIEIRGPNVFSGYWRMPEKTKEELRDNGFFISGDLGFLDDEGYISIVGRSKDLIISGGYNIYPKEIELLIDDIEGVVESAVIGVPHPDFGEGVVAIVVRETSSQTDEAKIQDALKDQVARFKQPKQIFLVKELPRNTMGKVLKNELRETYNNQFTT